MGGWTNTLFFICRKILMDEYVDRCTQMLMEMTMMREFDLLTIVFLWLNLHRQLSDTRLTGRGINCNTEIRRKYIGNWNICINTVGHSVQKNPILYKLCFFVNTRPVKRKKILPSSPCLWHSHPFWFKVYARTKYPPRPINLWISILTQSLWSLLNPNYDGCKTNINGHQITLTRTIC